jgi:probable F420-dependent oxidoreductase
MRHGVVFPQTEIGEDRGAIRAYAQALEASGYHHTLVYEHVLGTDPEAHPGFNGPYDITSAFYEPMVLFGFLAALTDLELVSGVLILPQRQTALVAKQAASADVLCGGRLRIGVGLGWNAPEYEALNQDWRTRGRRIEEQIAVLRKLWTERSVTFEGADHRIHGLGLAPMPVQRPIPIWIGASSDAALQRAGRIADGWLPHGKPGPNLERLQAQVRIGAERAGRRLDDLGMEGRIEYGDGDLDRIRAEAEGWRAAGATHLSVNPMRAGLRTPDDHIEAIERIAPALAD